MQPLPALRMELDKRVIQVESNQPIGRGEVMIGPSSFRESFLFSAQYHLLWAELEIADALQ